MPVFHLTKIISGGQTGADRAALDWAIAHDLPHGGWCPAGRRAEDGVIPVQYQLNETSAKNYHQRTIWNVRDSDATLIVSLTPQLEGGTATTQATALRLNRPCLHLHAGNVSPQALRQFIESHNIRTLNIAGPRASKAASISAFVVNTLSDALLTSLDTPLPPPSKPRSLGCVLPGAPYRVFGLVVNNPASPALNLPKPKREALSQPNNSFPRKSGER